MSVSLFAQYPAPPSSSGGNQNVNLYDASGNAVNLGQQTKSASLPVTLASDQGANTNGSVVNASLTGTTASSASPPTNAVGFILEAPSTNTDNIRYSIGGTASTAAGMLMEPGRDTGYIPCAATISICAVASAGADAYSILWVLSS